MPFINSTSSAIAGRNPNCQDNLCPTKICGRLTDWLRLTKEFSRVQPCLLGRSAGSFPKQRLVIEPNSRGDAYFKFWPIGGVLIETMNNNLNTDITQPGTKCNVTPFSFHWCVLFVLFNYPNSKVHLFSMFAGAMVPGFPSRKHGKWG